MSLEFQTLNSKLTCPSRGKLIERSRLTPLYRELLSHRLTLVTAGAGYGKTTFVSQALANTKASSVWYSLDQSDRDLSVFLSYLLQGFSNTYPEFGRHAEQIAPMLWDSTLKPATVWMIICSALESFVIDDLIVVLDDFHAVGDRPDITRSVMYFLTHLPPRIRLVLISRQTVSKQSGSKQPGSKQKTGLSLSRLRVQRQILDITESDLEFTLREIHQLCRQLSGMTLTRTQSEQLREKTRGWAASLILFLYSAGNSRGDALNSLLDRLKGSRDTIRCFLEENVYDLLPDRMKTFLTRTAVLDKIDVTSCNTLLGIRDANQMLTLLVENHLFVFPVDKEKKTYTYHALWQDFLRSRLNASTDKEEINILHGRAARHFETRGMMETAMNHYFSAAMQRDACRILSQIGLEMAHRGRLQQLAFYLEKIPRPIIDAHPWLWFIQTFHHHISGRFEAAIKGYESGLELFQAVPDAEGRSRCLANLALIFYVRGDFKQAKETYRMMIGNDAVIREDRIEPLGYLIFMEAYSGRMDRSDELYEKGMAVIQALTDKDAKMACYAHLELNKGFRFLFAGRARQALDVYQHTSRTLENTSLERLKAVCYHLGASAHQKLGRYAKGLATVRQGIALARKCGFRDGVLGFPLLGGARNATALGELDMAEDFAGESLDTFERMGSWFGQGSALLEKGYIHFLKNRTDLAATAAQRGLSLIRGLDLPLLRAELLILMARVYMDNSSWDQAEKALLRAGPLVHFSIYHTCIIKLLNCRVTLALQGEAQCIPLMTAVIKECRKHDYDHLLKEGKKWVYPVVFSMPQAFARTAEIKQFKARVKEWAPPLTAFFFQRFSLCIGDRTVKDSEWKSTKALTLMKYLLVNQAGGFVGKEVLMEMLWPETDPDKSAKRFHVALAALRKVLEPDILAGQRSSYIISQNNTYKIDIKPTGRIDVDTFSMNIQAARSATGHETSLSFFLKAVSCYAGDFLENELLEEWTIRPRQLLKESCLDALKQLMRINETRQAYGECILYAEKYLLLDDCAEDIYRNLMGYHGKLGNWAGVAKTFNTCKTLLAKKLDCPVSPETEAVFTQIIPSVSSKN